MDAMVPCEWVESTQLHPSHQRHSRKAQRGAAGLRGYAVALAASMEHIYQGRPGETFFCASDIVAGWWGTGFIVYGPLLAGMSTILYEGLPVRPDAAIWWSLVEVQGQRDVSLPHRHSGAEEASWIASSGMTYPA